MQLRAVYSHFVSDFALYASAHISIGSPYIDSGITTIDSMSFVYYSIDGRILDDEYEGRYRGTDCSFEYVQSQPHICTSMQWLEIMFRINSSSQSLQFHRYIPIRCYESMFVPFES